MFDFIASVVFPQVTNILRDLALAACAALLTWAINKVQAQFIWIPMAQITTTKLESLNVLKLYEHYGALERSLPLLTAESQDLARAELEQCAQIRSEKIDRIYYSRYIRHVDSYLR